MTTASNAVDMRHTKLTAADAALIAGELVKPSWASRNEGIHERITFDDTLWGFELAGGAFYKTPLRVVFVRAGSRAEQACIRKGDTVLRINGIDTSTLTLQEAHDIVLESGIHLKISVTSPDDDENAYYSYEDSLADENRIAEELRRAMEAERIRRAIERAARSCSLPWPWVKRKIIIYRESNCFLVPSKYEDKHKELYPELPHVRYTDDICEFNRGTPIETKEIKPLENGNRANSEETEKGEHVTDNEEDFDNLTSVMEEKEQNKIINEILEKENEDEVINKNIPSDVEDSTLSDIEETAHSDTNGEVVGPDNEEDSLSRVVEDNKEAKVLTNENNFDKLEVEEDNENETLDKNDNSQTTEANETKTDIEVNDPSVNVENEDENVENEDKNVENDDENVENEETNVENDDENVENEDENVENEAENITVPTSELVNVEDGVNKSDDDTVVDGILGDGDIND